MKKLSLRKLVLLLTVFVLAFSVCAVYAEEEYTYESEFAKLPDDVKAMENIRLIDDHDEEVMQASCGDHQWEEHLFGSSYFTGDSGGTLQLEFAGTLIGVLVEKGGFDIYIDDEYIDTLAIPANGGTQLLYLNDKLENDYHVITVVTNKEAALENTPENYSVFRGFIVQDVVEPIPTAEPTEPPTEAPATEVPPATDVPTQAPTAQPTEAAKTPAPKDPSQETKDDNSTLLIIIIVIAVLIIAASLVLIILKKKKK